ncbi:hypothetical protein [Priestia megaterium]|uniref:Uncharacterized protein n=1 Tax=Priestia megaterium TaxID=1404 RepID=A0A6M6DMZ4_PRIMG|nr:hypothetical protein [Priestia megaterium]QJX74726.1 hypothetical protein FDZ14_00470 [Priestia megaterium]
MAYIHTVDHDERKIHFAVHFFRDKFSKTIDETYTGEEENEEFEHKLQITKATMMKRFLKESGKYFTVTQVSKMLKVDVKSLRKSVIADKLNEQGEKKHPGQYKLETYNVEYYYTKTLSSNIEDWDKGKPSNLVTLVHYRDLYNFLFKVIQSSYTLIGGHSVLYDPREKFIKDAYYRTVKTTKWLADKDIYNFFKHQHTESEIEKLIMRIINGEVELHSKATLKDIVKKGDTTYDRLTKSLDSIKIKFNENNKKLTSRYVFLKISEDETEQEEFIANQIVRLLSMIANNKVAIIPRQLPANHQFKVLKFEQPIDYLSLYIEGYTGLPQGYYRASNGLLYFAVEESDTELKGVNIKSVIIPEEEVDREAIRLFLEVAYNAFEKMRKK